MHLMKTRFYFFIFYYIIPQIFGIILKTYIMENKEHIDSRICCHFCTFDYVKDF